MFLKRYYAVKALPDRPLLDATGIQRVGVLSDLPFVSAWAVQRFHSVLCTQSVRLT
ncbi:hypothetical protein Pfra02_08700 [Pseudomonas fragi]|nr:hypothetical protein Pfra02_08700 [Pseudomonas fragi]